jgi:hypothetical protein
LGPLVLVSVLLGACTADADPPSTAVVPSEPPTLSEAMLDAVVRLDLEGFRADGSVDPPVPYCSGVLVAPSLLLTAKHCAFADKDLRMAQVGNVTAVFRNGARVSVGRFPRVATPSEGGILDRGYDMAVLSVEAVATPAPLAIRSDLSLPLGVPVALVGYGGHEMPPGALTVMGARLVSVAGAFLRAQYGSYEAFVRAAETGGFDLPTPQLYERELLLGREAYGQVTSVHPCKGDSGGPVFAKDETGKVVVIGVTTAVLFSRGATHCGGGVVVTRLTRGGVDELGLAGLSP